MRWSRVPLLVTVLVLLAPAAVAAPVSFSYTVSTHTLRYHGTDATASITLRTGPSAPV